MRYATDHGFFELDSFPGNPALVIARSACIRPEARGNGHGKQQAALMKAEAQRLGYTYIIRTVRADNEPQRAICTAVFDAKELATFVNPMTGNTTALLGSPL